MMSTPCVLIVEDNFVLLEILTRLCEQQGIRVLSASSGEGGLTMLRRAGDVIDWLITDISLPGLVDGWEVAEAYRARHPDRPVIYASAGTPVEQRTVPGSLFIRKPFQVREVVAIARMMRTDAARTDGLRAAG